MIRTVKICTGSSQCSIAEIATDMSIINLFDLTLLPNRQTVAGPNAS